MNVFGGGLGLYNAAKQRLGGVGVSGDTSCADHVIAWRVRDALGLDNIPGGVAAGTDNIIYDLTSIEASPAAAGANTGGFTSPSGFGHPTCGGDADGAGDGDSESLGQALLLIGLAIATISVLIYVATAAKKGKKPELVDGIVVFIGAVSLLSAIRLAGFVFTGEFSRLTAASHTQSLWALSSEDAVFIVAV